MVSTRGPKSRYFEKGEKVLCYEPDPSKAKVLYDSKILGTYETKDKRGRKTIQYKVHFQGWSSSWDRKVSADFVLKDTEENRKLQRDLAEKAQLQLGAYLYRKERSSNKKRLRKSAATSEDSADASTSPSKLRPRGLSEDNFSSGSTFEKHEEDCYMNCETDSYSSSIESIHDEDRVMLHSKRLRQYLEYDHDMIVKYAKQHTLPSRLPAIAILENFVKQTAVKMVFSTTQAESTRRRNTQQRTDKKEKEFDKIITTVGLLKEVADGLRIYFDFTVTDHLLYKEEKEHAFSFLSEENLKNFTYVPTPAFSLDWFNAKSDTNEVHSATMQTSSEHTETATTSTLLANTAVVSSTQHMMETTTMSIQEDQPQRRKLRSHRSDDCDLTLENCLSSIASTSSGASTPLHSSIPISNLNYLKSLQPISPQIRDFLQSVLSWRLLPSNAAPGPSMIFGAPHLARLIVKLPEFLNATNMSDDKLKVLLQHLDTFTNYLESHKEWFNEDNYARSSSLKRTKLTDAKIETTVFQDQRQQQLEQQRHQNLVLSASLQDIQEDISTSLIANDTIIHSPQQPDAQINPSS
ncbi:LOW QUALITY PROTEIN: protein male-specific lethal-3-like [Glossina fuscipes fuscipes]